MKPIVFLRTEQGFTLVELMVALVLGVLVVLGVVQIYLTTLQTSRTIVDVSSRREVVSYFSNVVGSEVRASFDVYPVSGGAPVSSSGNLQINFNGDAADPPFSELYCPSSEELEALEYFSEYDAITEASNLVVVPFCSSSGRLAEQKVISGVESLQFQRGTGDRFVDVTLTMSSDSRTFADAAAEKNTIYLRMVSRSVSIFE